MTGDKRYFMLLDGSITGKVKFGDDLRIYIKGKRSIEFIDWNGETRTMTEIYYILDLKSSIICLGQAKESGCDVRLRGDYLTMHDRDGKFLVKANKSRKRLNKVYIGLKEYLCLHSTSMEIQINGMQDWTHKLRESYDTTRTCHGNSADCD